MHHIESSIILFGRSIIVMIQNDNFILNDDIILSSFFPRNINKFLLLYLVCVYSYRAAS